MSNFSESYIVPRAVFEQLAARDFPAEADAAAPAAAEHPPVVEGATALSRLARYYIADEKRTISDSDKKQQTVASSEKTQLTKETPEDAVETVAKLFPPNTRHKVYSVLKFVKEKASDKILWDPKTLEVTINGMIYKNSSIAEIIKFYFGLEKEGRYLSEYKAEDFDFAPREDIEEELKKVSFPRGAWSFVSWLDKRLPPDVRAFDHFQFDRGAVYLAKQFYQNILQQQAKYAKDSSKQLDVPQFFMPASEEDFRKLQRHKERKDIARTVEDVVRRTMADEKAEERKEAKQYVFPHKSEPEKEEDVFSTPQAKVKKKRRTVEEQIFGSNIDAAPLPKRVSKQRELDQFSPVKRSRSMAQRN